MNKLFTASIIVTSVAITLCLPSGLQADIAFDNFDTDWGAMQGNGKWVSSPADPLGKWSQAWDFTPGASGYVTDVWAAVTHTDPYFPEEYASCELTLMEDDEGLPGQTLEIFHFEDEVPHVLMGIQSIHKGGSATTYLEAGQTYWLMLGTDTEFLEEMQGNVVWGQNIISDTGTSARLEGSTGQWQYVESDQYRGAFRIDVTPEPSTLALLGLSIAAFLPRKRRAASR